ncbi:Uncharacterized protein APZ42_019218 [Daphnia magna]|uniref:Uncharacterized protein n=1 Tax=Daphnia magna TaxID=35525 RepID=A0A164YE33_9CRUS|nr:Uncharacterized protein APZ42_019218 [Daphnia magna]
MSHSAGMAVIRTHFSAMQQDSFTFRKPVGKRYAPFNESIIFFLRSLFQLAKHPKNCTSRKDVKLTYQNHQNNRASNRWDPQGHVELTPPPYHEKSAWESHKFFNTNQFS